MFKFLKEKLKGWFKTSEEKLEPVEEKKQVKPVKKTAKVVEKIKEKPIKEEKRKRTSNELEEERKVGEDLIEDIKKEKGTDEIKPIPRQEEIEEELKRVSEDQVLEAEVEKLEGEEPEIEKEVSEKPKKSFFERIGLVKKYKISEETFNDLFDGLETILLENNVALEVVDYLKESLRKDLLDKEVRKEEVDEKIREALRNALNSLFAPEVDLIKAIKEKEGVFVIVFFGINGSGKTTSIAKIAHLLKQNGISSVFAASDTFRAASIEQLSKHGEKLGIKVVHQHYGADPAAVAYDAIEWAKAHKIKAVLIDTAGRMYTEKSLMKEMEKITRVTKPDMKIFVAESIAGNDAVEQAKAFNETAGIDGIILSKADVDEKGGTSLSVSYVTKKPILFLGMGQEYKDLEAFKKEKLIDSLL